MKETWGWGVEKLGDGEKKEKRKIGFFLGEGGKRILGRGEGEEKHRVFMIFYVFNDGLVDGFGEGKEANFREERGERRKSCYKKGFIKFVST